MIQLFLQCTKGSANILQHIAHGFAQQLDRRRHFSVPRRKRLHTYRLQCIIEKMRIDLTGQHLKLHLLLPDQKRLLFDLRLVDLRLLLLDILHHDFQICKGFRQLIIPLKDRDQLIVLVAGLVHLLSQHAHPLYEISSKKMDHDQRDRQRQQ